MAANRIVRSSARTRILCKRCGQKKAWSLRARHQHTCPHGKPCLTSIPKACPLCVACRQGVASTGNGTPPRSSTP